MRAIAGHCCHGTAEQTGCLLSESNRVSLTVPGLLLARVAAPGDGTCRPWVPGAGSSLIGRGVTCLPPPPPIISELNFVGPRRNAVHLYACLLLHARIDYMIVYKADTDIYVGIVHANLRRSTPGLAASHTCPCVAARAHSCGYARGARRHRSTRGRVASRATAPAQPLHSRFTAPSQPLHSQAGGQRQPVHARQLSVGVCAAWP